MSKFYKFSRLIFIMLALILGLTLIPFVPSSLAAQGSELAWKDLDLQVWPEYDDPRVLVIYNGTLTNISGKEYRGRVYFNIPKGITVNEIQMACEIVNGGHQCQPYEIEDKGDYQVLSWKLTRPVAPGEDYPVWLEYYYNPLTGSPDKTMTFDYIPYYKTENVKVTVKEPLKSTNFKIDPAPTSTGQDGEGFNNYIYNFQNIDANTPVKLNISYTRSEKKPSVEKANPNTNQQKPSDPLGTSAWKKPEVLVPVALFVIVLIAFIFYSMYYSKNQPPTDRVNRIHKKYGGRNNYDSGTKSNASPKTAREKKRIRQLLLDGKISEETYRELIADLEAGE